MQKETDSRRSFDSDSDDASEELSTADLQAVYPQEYSVERIESGDLSLSSGGQLVYTCLTSRFGFNKPNYMLHRGGQLVGACKLHAHSFTCGVGSNGTSMIWIDVRRDLFAFGAVPRRAYVFDWAGKRYIISKAAAADQVGRGLSQLRPTHCKIVDTTSGRTVGLLVAGSPWSHNQGTIKIAAGVDPELEVLIVLSTLAWMAKVRRRAGAVAAAGGAVS